MPNLISVRDTSGKFILVNNAIANLYGYEASDLIGRNDEELTHQPWKIESCIEIDTMVMQQKTGKDNFRRNYNRSEWQKNLVADNEAAIFR